jgi:hypothetical protein
MHTRSCKCCRLPSISLTTAIVATELGCLLQALGLAVELSVTCHRAWWAAPQGWNPILALDGLPALAVPSGKGPHVVPRAGEVVAEAVPLFRLRNVPAAGTRVRVVSQHQRCSNKHAVLVCSTTGGAI